MTLAEINPHIRYAAIHYNHFDKPYDSLCYDCRLFFIRNAEGIFIANNIRSHFSDCTAIFLPPGSRYHLYLSKESKNPQITVMDFDLIQDYSYLQKSLSTATEQTFNPELVLTYTLPTEFAAPFIKNASSIHDILVKCCNEFLTQTLLYKESASALLKFVLIELVRKNSSDTELQKIAPVLSYIQGNFQNADLTNEVIAELFSYHPYYLSQLFKQCTGKSLHQYLIQYRLNIAQKSLITTNDSIQDVAWKSGFRSTAYFIKMFREFTGTTPGAFRKEHVPFLF